MINAPTASFLLYLAGARGRVLDRSHFLILLLLILLISFSFPFLFSPQ